MKKLLNAVLLTSLCFFSVQVSAQYYIIPPLVNGNPGGLNQDDEYPVGGGLDGSWLSVHSGSASTPAWTATLNLPFSFNFNGNTFNSFKVSTSGILTFDVSAVTVPGISNGSLPDAGIPDNSICVWGLDGPGSNDNIVVKTFGSSGSRQYWVFFSSYNHDGGGANCWTYWSIVLEETTNNIYIVDQRTTSSCTPSLTLGLQYNATSALQVSGSPNISSNTVDDFTSADNRYWTFVQGTQPSYDLSVLEISNAQYLAMSDAPFTLTGELVNYGQTATTSFDLNYSIDGGSTVTANVNASVASGTTYTFSHPTAWNPGAEGDYTISVWASNINGNNDENTSNDVGSKAVSVAAVFIPRIPLIEDFGSATCPPCATLAATFDPLLLLNSANDSCGDITAIKYQMNWPPPGNDPSYTDDADTRKVYYSVSGIPHTVMDGEEMSSEDQAAIDSRKQIPAFMNLWVETEINGNAVSVTANVAAFADYNSTTMKLHIAVVEDYIRYADHGYNPTTSQSDYYQVMRKMLPDGNGTSMSAMSSGDSLSVTESFTFTIGGIVTSSTTPKPPYLWVGMNNISVIAWVQDDADKAVHQSGGANCFAFTTSDEDGNVQVVESGLLGIFPNPAYDEVHVKYLPAKNGVFKVEILDALGRIVVSENHEASGSGLQDVNLNTSGMNAGVYFVNITLGEKSETVKLLINK